MRLASDGSHTRKARDLRERWIAPIAVGVLVVVALGASSLLAGDGVEQGSSPPPLRLTAVAGSTVGAPTAEKSQRRFVLTGSLPQDVPARGQVYRLGTTPRPTVRQLTDTLGLPGNPDQHPQGWRKSANGLVLTINGGGSWAWRLDSASTAEGPVQCIRAPCPGEGVPPYAKAERPAPSAEIAQQVASRALRALGLPTRDLLITTQGELTSVTSRPRIDGRQTYGFDTVISVGPDRTIRGGHGWLGMPQRQHVYPLINAATAFQRLLAQPHPEVVGCRPDVSDQTSAPQCHVTDARLGLMMAGDSHGAVLVPAWLFSVDGQREPLPFIAIDPRYLKPPTDGESPGTPSGGGR